MEEIKKLLKEVLNREFIRAVISSPKEKEGTAVLLECGTEPVQGILKIKVRPLERGIDVPIRSVYEDAGISPKFKSRSGG